MHQYYKRVCNIQDRYLEARANTVYRFEILKDLYKKEIIGTTVACKTKKLKKKLGEITDHVVNNVLNRYLRYCKD